MHVNCVESTVWNKHVRYYQDERVIEEPDVYPLFIDDLRKALGDLRDFGHHVVLGMDANNEGRDGAVSAALAEIGIQKAVIKNHRVRAYKLPVQGTHSVGPLAAFGFPQALMFSDMVSSLSIACRGLTQITK